MNNIKVHCLIMLKDGKVDSQYINVGETFDCCGLPEVFKPYLDDCIYYGQEDIHIEGSYYKMLYTYWNYL